MEPTPTVEPPATRSDAFALTDAQVEYFRTFGYLRLPGLFLDDIGRLTEGFEDVFADETNERLSYQAPLHGDGTRVNLLTIVDRSPKLSWLHDDPRVQTIGHTLVEGQAEFAGSDGSLFYCDTSWHPDDFGAPPSQHHVKLSWYLDDLTGETGAIRVLPGTNHWQDRYAQLLRAAVRPPADYLATYGMADHELPGHVVPSRPGDLICWDYRTLHASFGGDARRRLFSYSFRDAGGAPTAD